MAYMVLGTGYRENEKIAVRTEWQSHDVDFYFVDSIEDAVRELRENQYVCVTISSHISDEHLEILRRANSVPIVVISPDYNVSKRADFFRFAAGEYIQNTKRRKDADISDGDNIDYYLGLTDKGDAPLTVLADSDLYFCLEYRTVRVHEQKIELTPMKFDALYLLLANKQRVLTFETISVRVWGEEYYDNTPKVINNLIGRLRQKLKVSPDAPNYIKNVRGVGYKFDSR